MKQCLLLSHANDNHSALQEGAVQSQSGFILNLCMQVSVGRELCEWRNWILRLTYCKIPLRSITFESRKHIWFLICLSMQDGPLQQRCNFLICGQDSQPAHSYCSFPFSWNCAMRHHGCNRGESSILFVSLPSQCYLNPYFPWGAHSAVLICIQW